MKLFSRRALPSVWRGCLSLSLLCLPAGFASAQGFDDNFQAQDDLKAVLKDYAVGKWASQGTASGSADFDSQKNQLTLTASALDGDKELPAFTLVTMMRSKEVLRLGPNPDVELQAVVEKYDSAPFGDKPVAMLVLGLTTPRGGGSVTAQFGVIGRPNAKKVGYAALIEVQDDDGKNNIVEITGDDLGHPGGKTLALQIKGDQVDLLLDGQSIVDGPVALGVDLKTSSLATDGMVPTVQVRKNFGKQARSATISRLSLKNATDPDSVQALLPVMTIKLDRPDTGGQALKAQQAPSRPYRPDFVGYNGNLSSFNQPWNDQALIDATRFMQAGTVRYPAGSIGNVWDWDLGWVLQDIDYSKTIKWVNNIRLMDKRYTLENLAKGSKETGFAPVFMLNMIHHTLDEHVGHLKKMESLGIEVKYVELGNEYYFGRGADAYMNDKWPTAADYGRDANRWTARLKSEFPGVEIAACGSGGGPKSSSDRRQTWNDVMLPVLDPAVDAITIHKYVGHGLDGLLEGNDMENFGSRYPGRIAPKNIQQAVTEKLKTAEGLAFMLTRPDYAWHEMQQRTLVPDMPIWLTEFNIDDQVGSVRNTWSHALFIVAYMDVFLTDERVKLVHFHNLYGGDLYPALWSENGLPKEVLTAGKSPKISEFDLTAGGMGMQVFSMASQGSETARRISFADAPTVTVDLDNGEGAKTYDLIYGWQFDHGLLLMNGTDTQTSVTLPDNIGRQMNLMIFSADVTDIVAGLDSVQQESRTVSAGQNVTLPPHAIAVATPEK